MQFKNGLALVTQLAKTLAGHFLIATAARSFDRMAKAFKKQFGYDLKLTQGYRDHAEQTKIFEQRYAPQKTGNGPFGDVRWWKGIRYVRVRGAAAAVPGTSNHGLGLAVDISTAIGFGSFTSAQYKWLAKNGPKFGWTNIEGRSVNEPWHWVYKESNDTKRGTRYTVNVKLLNGRSAASTTSRIKIQRKKDFVVIAKRTVKANGYLWAETHFGTFYAIQALDGSPIYMKQGKTIK